MHEMQPLRPVRRVFSRIGIALSVMTLAALLAQTLWFTVPVRIPQLAEARWWTWLGLGVPMYLVALPLALLIIRKLPAQSPEKKPFGVGRFLIFLPIAFAVTIIGNLIGTFLSMLLSAGVAENPLNDFALDNHPLKFVIMVLMAPVMEELIFRKLLIDRTVRYGEKLAVLVSALVFGLFHQNLFQFFYAFGAGLLLGYLYVRSGKLRYPILLHMAVNFNGSVLAPAVMSLLPEEQLLQLETLAPEEMAEAVMPMLPKLMGMLLYVVFQYGMLIAGVVLFALYVRKLTWQPMPEQLPGKTGLRAAWLNAGMVIFTVLCLLFMAISLL